MTTDGTNDVAGLATPDGSEPRTTQRRRSRRDVSVDGDLRTSELMDGHDRGSSENDSEVAGGAEGVAVPSGFANEYLTFIDRKSQSGRAHGFEPIELPSCLKPFQTYLVEWALRRGRAAIFADCGMGKTIMQLVWADNVLRHTGKPVLICTPLTVSSQTLREAEKFGIAATRSQDGTHNGGLVITNYERLDHFSAGDFVGIVCDESSILKSIGGQTRKRLTRFMSKLPFRLLCTATAAPNDYVELGTSSEALGELSHSDMLRRFFAQLDDKGQRKEQKAQDDAEVMIEIDPSYYQKLAYRVAQTIGQWRLKHHAVEHFWKWVASWARACRMPSDLGFDDAEFVLPKLIERDHVIDVPPPPGMLFHIPARGIGDERAERRRTIVDRCKFITSLVSHDRPAIVWCHGNDESDMLEEFIPNGLQVAGRHSDEYKISVTEWFLGNRCICNDSAFSKRLISWQQRIDLKDIGRNTIANIVNNALSHRSNTEGCFATRGEVTSPNTTETTKTDTRELQNKKWNAVEIDETGTQWTQRTEKFIRKTSKSIENESLKYALHERCVALEQLSKSTTNLPLLDVLSAEQRSLAIEEVIDFILTTITKRGSSGGCCVPSAILDLESLRIIQTDLSKLLCICGCASGNRKLITKSKIYGFGLNFQHCDHVVACATHSWEQYYQSIRRCWRFGQKNQVVVDVVATEGEVRVLGNMRRKAERADVMFAQLVKHMQDAQRIERENIYTNSVEAPQWL